MTWISRGRTFRCFFFENSPRFFHTGKNQGGGWSEKTHVYTSKFSEGCCFSESLLFAWDMHRNTLSVWKMVEITLTARSSTCVKGTKMTVGMEMLQKTVTAAKMDHP